MSYELPSSPLSIGGVIDSAIRLYRHSIRHCWILALIYAGLIGASTIVWSLALVNVVPGRTDPKQLLGLMFSAATIIPFLLMMVVSFMFYGALIKAESVLARGDPPLSLGEAIAAGARRLPGMALGSLISLVAIGVGFILLIFPGVYLLGRIQLWVAAMFLEEAGTFESFEISWRLTRGRWWRGTTILTVGFILLYVFALAFGLIAGITSVVVHLTTIERVVVNQLFSVLSNIIVLPIFVAIVLVMYHDFKLRSEGGDLAARVGSLGKA
jgi:hypothetical protein